MDDCASRPVTGSAPEHPKEVARVISNKYQMTAQSPTLGAPAYGQASFEASAISAAVAGVQVSTCARFRHTGDMGLVTVKGDFPGTSAWRPPIC
jgi:hypothetical protein